MRSLLKKYLLTLTVVYTLTLFIPAVSIAQGWSGLFYASLVLSILFYIARPIVNLIMLPLNILTLNLSAWLINIVIFYLWTVLVPEVEVIEWSFAGASFGNFIFSSYNFAGWQVIIICAIFITMLNQFLNWVMK